MASKPNHLEPSELGTKQYWDALYATELTNHSSNPADEGTVWFDDSDAEAKLLSFLDAHSSSDDPSSQLRLSKAATSFLDLGCGNGSLLFALRDDGWDGRLLGVDYSEASVALAVRVGEGRRRRALGEEGEEEEEELQDEEGEENTNGGAEESKRKRLSYTETQEGVDGNAHDDKPISAPAPGGKNKTVDFMVWDVLAGPLDAVRSETNRHNGDASTAGWDVVLDKGTFDAVSLSSQRDDAGRRICEGYRDRVLRLLRPGGVFLVTSCNWTEAELKGWFEGDGREMGRLKQVDRVEYRSFSFGGVKGQTISTVCFMKE